MIIAYKRNPPSPVLRSRLRFFGSYGGQVCGSFGGLWRTREEKEKMIGIIIWSIGGQGGVIGSKIILSSAINSWPNSQVVPVFNAERRGAPVLGSMRIAGKHENVPGSQIEEPDCVILFKESLLKNPQIAEKIIENISQLGMNDFLIINSANEPEHFNNLFSGRKATINATLIALKLGIGNPMMPIVNTAMAGGIVKIFNFDFELLCESMKKEFGKNAKINIDAAQIGYNEVKYNDRKK